MLENGHWSGHWTMHNTVFVSFTDYVRGEMYGFQTEFPVPRTALFRTSYGYTAYLVRMRYGNNPYLRYGATPSELVSLAEVKAKHEKAHLYDVD